jgi:hypothetical protein
MSDEITFSAASSPANLEWMIIDHRLVFKLEIR